LYVTVLPCNGENEIYQNSERYTGLPKYNSGHFFTNYTTINIDSHSETNNCCTQISVLVSIVSFLEFYFQNVAPITNSYD